MRPSFALAMLSIAGLLGATTSTTLLDAAYIDKKRKEEDEEEMIRNTRIQFTEPIKNYPSIPVESQTWRKPFKQQGSKFIPNSKNRR